MDDTPQRVLVVIPHPNDAEFWCGGSIAQWIIEGATVRYVVCTDGSKGTTDPAVSASDLAATRQQEQADAAQELGVQELVSLGMPDGGLEDVDDFRRELVRQIRQVQPDVVVCPEPYRKNLAWHRDSRITGQVALDAVFPCARDHLHFEELWRDEGLEPHKTGTVLFWGAEDPNAFVDIGQSIEAKTRAVKAGKTRTEGRTGEEIDAFIRKQGQEGAGDSRVSYAEAFRRINFRT
jgi:LmbE family N-acetylglucosaminyl deacetylase